MNERRSLRQNCKPALLKELYQEATSTKPLLAATILDDEDTRTEYSRRTYERSALEYAAEVNNMRIISTKVHQYELESLVAASREGREDHLRHRPLYDRDNMIQWMLKHLTLQKTNPKLHWIELFVKLFEDCRRMVDWLYCKLFGEKAKRLHKAWVVCLFLVLSLLRNSVWLSFLMKMY